MKPLILTLIFASAALAQDCPLQVTDVVRWSPGGQGSELRVSLINTSNKEISKASIAVSVLDSAGQPHPLTAAFDSGKVKAGGKKKIKNWFDRESLDPITRLDYQAAPRSIEFVDGSTWSADAGACVWTKK